MKYILLYLNTPLAALDIDKLPSCCPYKVSLAYIYHVKRIICSIDAINKIALAGTIPFLHISKTDVLETSAANVSRIVIDVRWSLPASRDV